MTEPTNLPTVEECREFRRLVNVGREAAKLEPLDVLNFDDAVPADPWACLSATNLFRPCGFHSVADQFDIDTEREPDADMTQLETVAAAIGATRFVIGLDENDPYKAWNVPPEILTVTDHFDSQTPGLRERLVEAGVVAP